MSYDPGSPDDRGQPPGGPGWQGQPPPGGGYGQQPPPNWGPGGPPPGGPPPGGFGGGFGPGGPGGPSGPPAVAAKGFFAALFDFSFSGFATFGFVKILYVVGAVIIGLGWLGYTAVAFYANAVAGIITLIIGAVVALFTLAFLRLSLEFYYAVARMSEDIHNRR